jgi:hypothetical protein
MVVSARSSHPSRINVVGHGIAIVGERHLTDGALPVLFDDLPVEQLPHFCFGAEFAISPGVVWVFDTCTLRRLSWLAFWTNSRPQQERDR